MSGAVVAVALLQVALCGDPVRITGTVGDAATRLPIGDALLSTVRDTARSRADGTFVIYAAPCDTLHVRRLGYAARRIGPGADLRRVELQRTGVVLRAVDVRAETPAGRAIHSREAAAARTLGGATATDLVASLPFVVTRSTSGRTAIGVRASRPEQVIVLLDGVPLNDPMTGAADPSDIPLVAIAAASVAPGAAAAAYGSGAAGGVVALNSSDRSMLVARVGSLGRLAIEGAGSLVGASGRATIGAAYGRGTEDFTFRNTAAVPPGDTIERRVNNDHRRASAFASLVGERVQALVLHSDVERGLVGPMNVRAFDDDRGRTSRSLVQVATAFGPVEARAGTRLLRARYSTSRGSLPPFDVSARSHDLSVGGAVRGFTIRAGGGYDAAHGSTLDRVGRARGFASAATRRRVGSFDLSAALRADATEGAGSALSPELTVMRSVGPVGLTVRAAQAFRIPTFYDLYFASPQRIGVQALAPERVTHDLELRANLPWTCAGAGCTGRVELSLFDRRTEGAIVWFPGNVGWSPQNVPVERARGAEAHASLQAGTISASAWGGLYSTFLWDGYLEMRTPYAPYWAAGADLRGRLGAFTGAAAVRHVGRRPFVNGPAIAELELPPATTIDAGVQRTVRVDRLRLTVDLSVRDLTNTRAEEVRRYPTPGRTWSAGLTIEP